MAACADPPRPLDVAVPRVGTAEARLAAAFQEAHPGVEVRLVEAAGVPPAVAEGGAVPDVWWGADGFALASAAREGRLAPLPRSAGIDTEGRWLPVERVVPVLAYNVDSLAPLAAPRDLRLLPHFRWTGRLLLPDPEGSTVGRGLVGWAMDSEGARTGDDSAGLDLLRSLDERAAAWLPDGELVPALARGRGVVAVADLAAVERARAEGLPVGWHGLEGGLPAVPRGVAVLEGADADPEAIAAFVAAAAGEAGRAALLDDLRLPAGGAEPEWARGSRRRLDMAPLRVDTVAARLPGWIERWRVEAKGRGGRMR